MSVLTQNRGSMLILEKKRLVCVTEQKAFLISHSNSSELTGKA